MRVCDPTAGSGGMLIQAVDYIKEKVATRATLHCTGQEKNLNTWAICKMNLLLHGLSDHEIKKGDTIREPKLLDENGELLLYDRVIANPPFSLKTGDVRRQKQTPFTVSALVYRQKRRRLCVYSAYDRHAQ
ncbi:hypothetical protein JS44_15285 [Anoxybacillus flavithermus]|uniref:site-specific DNA-methyltransferase (adenine-specific) n=1 Tax=Anoxybacillus flavithermus TaxID=33934 RepID=A0A094JI17_9BACL|nr:hypothetical protein JS44_15285 [Anoxybacillus flavithermus]